MWDRITKTSPFGAVLTAALDEAGRSGARRLGTDHLLLALLHDEASVPARALGITLERARAGLDDLDRTALATLGLELRGLEPPTPQPYKPLPLSRNNATSNARAVLRDAVNATGLRTRSLAPNHLLRSLLVLSEPDPAAELLAHLGIDPELTRERLAALQV
ncbi:Clp protease N-terminal domain-containing protein [Nocardia goodfellowii]